MNVLYISDGDDSANSINLNGIIRHSIHDCKLVQFIGTKEEMEWADVICVQYAGIIPTAPELYEALVSMRDKVWIAGIRGLGSIMKGFSRGKPEKYMKYFNAYNVACHELYGLIEEMCDVPIFVCHDGVDTDKFVPTPPPESFCIGWAGNPWTGAKYPQRLKDLPFPLKAVGGNPVFGIDFHPWIPHDEMPKFYSGISVYTSVSLYEGGPMPPLEAGASGRPTVATRTGALIEWIPQEYLVDVDNYLDMIPIIENLRDDDELYNKECERFRNLTLKWDFRHICKEYDKMVLELYE